MRRLLLPALVLLTTLSYGQSASLVNNVKVFYAEKPDSESGPAYFINGKFAGSILNRIFDPAAIADIHVIKQDILVDSVTYHGQIYIKTKEALDMKFITLTNIKSKYTNLGNKSAVFMIDGNIVNTDYDKCLVDENYLLQIIVDNISNTKEQIEFSLIKILTKTEENIKKTSEIRLRGGEMAGAYWGH